jgi:hypothetical protein
MQVITTETNITLTFIENDAVMRTVHRQGPVDCRSGEVDLISFKGAAICCARLGHQLRQLQEKYQVGSGKMRTRESLSTDGPIAGGGDNTTHLTKDHRRGSEHHNS